MNKKDSSIFLYVALFMMIGSTFFFYQSFNQERPSFKKLKDFDELILSFQETNKPVKKINFDLIERNYLCEELAESQMPNFFQEERYRHGPRFLEAYNCDSGFQKAKSTKEDIWQGFVCGDIPSLPFGFFDEPPYLSETGYSFVFLAINSHMKKFDKEEWIKTHRQYLSFPELIFSHHIRQVLNIPDYNLSTDFLNRMASAEKIISDENFIFIKDKGDKLNYSKYSFTSFKDSMEKKGDFVIKENGLSCLYENRFHCISVAKSEAILLKEKAYDLSAIFLISMAGLFLFLFRRNFVSEREEDKMRKLALDNLTHDLRTPVANLILLSEKLDKVFDQNDEQDHEQWLLLNSQIHRLRRLTENTRHYISLRGASDIEYTYVKSMNAYLNEMAEDEEILFIDKTSEEISLETNLYWLGVCLKNLIKNAKDHGGEKIELKLRTLNNRFFEISVSDNGKGLKVDFSNAKKEFVKSELSHGLGLGLGIAIRAAHLLKGIVSYESNPTTFKLKMKKAGYYGKDLSS